MSSPHRAQIVDRDRSGSLDAEEFANCCRINRLGLSDSEQRVLMRAFDTDFNGTINYDEFLRGVRGRLSTTRKKMVRTIFDALDKIGGDLGYLTIGAIKPIYSVSNHPQVKSGKMTKDEALQEFLSGFEGSQGNRDGKVTLDEWIKYYEEVSAAIDSDGNDLFACTRPVAALIRTNAISGLRAYARAAPALHPCCTRAAPALRLFAAQLQQRAAQLRRSAV